MSFVASALAFIRSATTTTVTGVFVPPISGQPDPYGIDAMNTLTAIELERGTSHE